MTSRATPALRRALAPVRDRTTWAGGALLVAGALPASVVLAVVAALLVVGGALTPVGVGIPVLLGALVVARAAAEADRRLFALALGADADLDVERSPLTGPAGAAGGWTARVRALLADRRTWRSTAWLAVRAGAGLLAVLGLLLTAVVAVALLAVPFADGYLAWGARWRSSAGWGSAWTLPVAAVLLLGVAHGVRLLVLAHARLAELLLGPDPDERLAALQRAVDASDARDRVARDLHDGLGHALTLVVVQAEAAATAVDADPAAARAHLAAVATAARTALADLDRALDALHRAPAPDPGLDDVPALVRSARAAGLDVGYAPSVAPSGAVEPAVAAAAYRVVQEGLTNVLRHSRSRTASVTVADDSAGLRVVVRSAAQARPAGLDIGPGRGLAGLRDRVAVTGGRLDVAAQDDAFVLEAVWPRS